METSDRITLTDSDITTLTVDAIVNAANSSMLGGGGVDGAIHRAAGPDLLDECRAIGGCPTGEARITRGHRLPARFVIHTVGPIWKGGQHGEPELFASCYRSVFAIVKERHIRTIAFPAISCGIYGYPVPEAARIAIAETISGLNETEQIDRVIFTCFTRDVLEAYRNALRNSW